MSINLIASNEQTQVKKILPRFPICYLTFKKENFLHSFEVVDISTTGMQLLLKYGEIPSAKKNDQVKGKLKWHGYELELNSEVVWATSNRLGLKFTSPSSSNIVQEFFSWKRLGKALKPVHHMDYPFELPPKLKYWLRADGPHEIFIWQYASGELESFSIIIRENLVHWSQEEGLKTGRVISQRRVKLPLSAEGEFIFLMDSLRKKEMIKRGQEFLEILEKRHLPEMVINFLIRKLRG